jgi:DNA polymerase-1
VSSYVLPVTRRDVTKALSNLRTSPVIALDTETYREGPFSHPQLCLLQLHDGYGVPCNGSPGVPLILTRGVIPAFRKAFPGFQGAEFIVHYAPFDLGVLKRSLGIEIPAGKIFDTCIASVLLTNTAYSDERKGRRPRDYKPNSLKSVVRRIVGMELDKDLQDSDWSGELSEEQLTYAALDVAYLHRIRLELRRQLELAKLWPVYELERDLAPCISQMGENGLPVDTEALLALQKRALATTLQREEKCLSLIGREINLRSRGKQLLQVLQEMGFTCQGRTIHATNKKVLPLLDQAGHPLISALLEWSSSNEEGKQLAQWIEKTDMSTGTSYPDIFQFGTITHRFTYKRPNFQQLKKSSIRSIVTAPKGKVIVRADFETLELIVAAVYHQEPKVLESLTRKEDLHALTASQIYKTPIPEISEKQRAVGKVTNFSRLYGTLLPGYICRCRLAGITLSDEDLERAYHAFDDVWVSLAAYRSRMSRLIALGRHMEGNALDVWAQNPAG